MLASIGIMVRNLLLVAVGFVIVFHLIGQSRLEQAPFVVTKPISIPTEAEAIARGEQLATISSCSWCHGADLSGKVLEDRAVTGYIPAPNITPAGVASTYSDADWERALRHGVAPDGRTLVIMPSHHYDSYNDEDLGALIAYLKTVPPVSNSLAPRKITFPGTIIFGVLAYPNWGVVSVNHVAVGHHPVPVGETIEYGQYLVEIATCGSCHTDNLTGNSDPNLGPVAPNITATSALQGWSEADFSRFMRTGTKPSGRQIDDQMPWRNYSHFSDLELRAIWLFLQSVEPSPQS
ncbi:MAG: cytochrome c [Chloroflexota bacterium]